MKRFLLILCLILSINAASFAVSSTTFPDAGIYYKEINYLSTKGIISGYEDGTFRPEGKITRAELVKMIVTATKSKSSKNSYFSDVSNNHWAKDYIDIAVANNLIKGDTAGTFRPEDNVTYGEVAAILVRAMGKEDAAEKLYLSWPDNYMQEAKYLELFEGYRSNDLVSINEARRDSVALMIYNMLNSDKDTAESPKESETIKLDTKVNAYAGIVTSHIERRGEQNIRVEDNEGNRYTFPMYKSSSRPNINSFIIYQLTDDDELKLRSEIKKSDISSGYYTVESVEDEIAKLKGQSKVLDLSLEKYTIGGKTYKLEKINFFIIELDEDENEFTDYRIEDVDSLKLKKDDKIKFDEKINVCYIIREV